MPLTAICCTSSFRHSPTSAPTVTVAASRTAHASCEKSSKGVRSFWPANLPLFVRISATDWVPGGWDIEQSVALARLLGQDGVDLIDVSSGGLSPDQQIQLVPGYQVGFAERIRREAGIPTGAVGLITTAAQADEIVRRAVRMRC